MKQFSRFLVIAVFLIAMCPLVVSAQMPSTTKNKFSTSEWSKYLKSLLYKHDAEDKKLIDSVIILVNDRETIGSGSFMMIALPPAPVIFVDHGLLDVCDTEDQCAFVVLHELGHIKYKYFRTKDPLIWLEHEMAVDDFAQQKIVNSGGDGCAGYVITNKTFGTPDINNPLSVYDIKRLGMMLVACKESMPHIPGKADPGPR